MKFGEVLKRVTGLSTPFIGISWNAKGTDRDHALELIAYLDDRRVLYNPSEMEVPRHCVDSILDIRKFLTIKIGVVRDERFLGLLRDMRSACRKFIDTVGVDEEIIRFGQLHGLWASWMFNGALGELRGVFGIYLAGISVMYKLDVEGDLSTILPIDENIE